MPDAGASRQRDVDRAMARYATGDGSAFGEVYDGIEPGVRSFIRRHMRDESRVDDLVQRTFLCVIRARSAFIPGAPAMPWVRSIARNLLCKLPKSARLEVPVDLQGPEVDDLMVAFEPSLEEAAIARQTGRYLAAAFAGLPPRQRRAMDLVFGEGLSHYDAAQLLRTSGRAVTLLIHKARKALRATILGADEVTR